MTVVSLLINDEHRNATDTVGERVIVTICALQGKVQTSKLF